ncbi:MAG: GIY-YIG nuclease family protein [Parvibaculaceae bacterium]
MRGGWAYFMTNRPQGILYLGVTADLAKRAWQHRMGTGSSFTNRYGLTRLAWYERHEEIESAIQRETSIKRWPRNWKITLIEEMNPDWRDLYEDLNR